MEKYVYTNLFCLQVSCTVLRETKHFSKAKQKGLRSYYKTTSASYIKHETFLYIINNVIDFINVKSQNSVNVKVLFFWGIVCFYQQMLVV